MVLNARCRLFCCISSLDIIRKFEYVYCLVFPLGSSKVVVIFRFIFTKFEHETITTNLRKNPNSGGLRLKQLELVQIASTERSMYFDEKQNSVLQSLHQVQTAASNIQTAIRLFQETDLDGSGELDTDELGQLMSRIGLRLTEKRLNELMSKYDLDGGGKIEIHEFLALLKSQYAEATQRMKELIESPVYALKGNLFPLWIKWIA
jgi:hypothetical protein